MIVPVKLWLERLQRPGSGQPRLTVLRLNCRIDLSSVSHGLGVTWCRPSTSGDVGALCILITALKLPRSRRSLPVAQARVQGAEPSPRITVASPFNGLGRFARVQTFANFLLQACECWSRLPPESICAFLRNGGLDRLSGRWPVVARVLLPFNL